MVKEHEHERSKTQPQSDTELEQSLVSVLICVTACFEVRSKGGETSQQILYLKGTYQKNRHKRGLNPTNFSYHSFTVLTT